MKVLFENSNGQRRVIGEATTQCQVNAIIKKFIDDRNFKSYYTRSWYKDPYTWFDVGSHSEFFLLEGNYREMEKGDSN